MLLLGVFFFRKRENTSMHDLFNNLPYVILSHYCICLFLLLFKWHTRKTRDRNFHFWKKRLHCFRSDVVVSAVGQNEDGTYYIFASGDLRNTLLAQLDDEEISFYYRTLHVQDVVVS